jgi:hypothetical protein
MRGAFLAVVVASGCAARPVPVEPGVTFAAHLEHGGLAVDRLAGGGTGVLEPPGWFRRPGAPTWVLRDGGGTLAALWVTAPSRVDVRRTRGAAGPPVARVEPSWEDGAVRLALVPAGGAPLHSTIFARIGAGGGTSVLTRAARTTLDVRGTFRAELEDADGAGVGWLQARIGPYQAAPRLYDAVLPPEVDDGLAAALIVALDGEVEWIESHAIDVYRGDDGGRLEGSFPLGR